jgi:signal transduction histidine kinase
LKCKQIIYAFFIFNFLLIQTAIGQKNDEYYQKNINKFNSKFDQNIVIDLLFDEDKILWIATPTGIFCYNGLEVKELKSPNNYRCVSFFRTTENKKLILFSDGNVYEIKKDGFTHYFKDFSQKDFSWNYKFLQLPIKEFEKIIKLKPFKTSYFSTKVMSIDKQTVYYNNLSAKNYSTIYKYNPSTLKIQTIDSIDNQKLKEYIFVYKNIFARFIDGSIKTIISANNARLMAFPELGFDKTHYKLFNKPNQNAILISNQSAWVLIHNKFKNEYQWKNITNKLPIEMSFQNALYVPELDKLFLGSESNGLLIFSKSNFSTKYNLKKVIKSNYYIQIPDLNGDILTNGCSVSNNQKQEPLYNNQVINNNYIFINPSTIITSTPEKVFTYNLKNQQSQTLFKTEINENANFFKYKQKVYIFGNSHVSIYNPENNTTTKLFNGELGYLNTNTVQLVNGNFWIGSTSGLTVYDPIKNKIIYKMPKAVTVRNIQKYQNEYYLTLYGLGISKIDSNTFQNQIMPMDVCGAIKYSHGFYTDKKGLIWIATNKGMLRFSAYSFKNAINRKKFLPEPDYFDTDDGLLTDEFNGGASPSFLAYGDSMVSFPSLRGIVSLKPNSIPLSQRNYNLNINKITYLNKEIKTIGNIINLTSNIEELTFDFNVVNWENQKNLNIYIDFDDSTKQIDYTQIHNFKLPIEFNGSKPVEIYTILSNGEKLIFKSLFIQKEFPWYLKVKYIILSILVLLFLSNLVSRIRTFNIKKKNTLLQKIIQEKTKEIQEINVQLMSKVKQLTDLNNENTTYISVINHDIFAPIKYINIIGDMIHSNSGKIQKNDVLLQFNQIINSTKRLEVLCSNILNYINTNSNISDSISELDLYKLVEDLKNFLEIGLQINNNKFQNNIPLDTKIVINRDAINIILTNILSNANRFTQNGNIIISYEINDNQKSIIIQDNGIGMDHETLEKIRNKTIIVSNRNAIEYQSYGIGYTLVYKMLSIIDGAFEIESEKDKGTSIKISWPNHQLTSTP